MTKLYKNLRLGATRMYSEENTKAWIKAEENLGLKNSLFITINGVTTQYYDVDEGEEFHRCVKEDLQKEGWFDELCEYFFEVIKNKDKVAMFRGLAIFNEIEEHLEIATEDQLRRLKRVRESTHEEIYKW